MTVPPVVEEPLFYRMDGRTLSFASELKALFADPNQQFTPHQLLSYGFKNPMVFQPGEAFQYSNTNKQYNAYLTSKFQLYYPPYSY